MGFFNISWTNQKSKQQWLHDIYSNPCVKKEINPLLFYNKPFNLFYYIFPIGNYIVGFGFDPVNQNRLIAFSNVELVKVLFPLLPNCPERFLILPIDLVGKELFLKAAKFPDQVVGVDKSIQVIYSDVPDNSYNSNLVLQTSNNLENSFSSVQNNTELVNDSVFNTVVNNASDFIEAVQNNTTDLAPLEPTKSNGTTLLKWGFGLYLVSKLFK